jgi:hypothetical protein
MRREPSLASALSIPHFYNVNLAQFPSYGNPIGQPGKLCADLVAAPR